MCRAAMHGMQCIDGVECLSAVETLVVCFKTIVDMEVFQLPFSDLCPIFPPYMFDQKRLFLVSINHVVPTLLRMDYPLHNGEKSCVITWFLWLVANDKVGTRRSWPAFHIVSTYTFYIIDLLHMMSLHATTIPYIVTLSAFSSAFMLTYRTWYEPPRNMLHADPGIIFDIATEMLGLLSSAATDKRHCIITSHNAKVFRFDQQHPLIDWIESPKAKVACLQAFELPPRPIRRFSRPFFISSAERAPHPKHPETTAVSVSRWELSIYDSTTTTQETCTSWSKPTYIEIVES